MIVLSDINRNLLPTEAETGLIENNINSDVRQLALRLKPTEYIRPQYVLQQIAGRQMMRKKVPSWTNLKIIYPIHLSVEQCSSEATAKYKVQVVKRLLQQYKATSFVDVTGGLGVDFSFLSPLFQRSTYIEQNEELSHIALHNFDILGLNDYKVICDDGIEFLTTTEAVNCIYIDPARRSASGAKTIRIADCTPDLTQIEQMLVDKADFVVVKLSPMHDISMALSELKYVLEVHIVSVANECKELLLVLDKNVASEPKIYATNDNDVFVFLRSEEPKAECQIAQSVGRYLYEPNASLLKAGVFKLVAAKYGLQKLHLSSHLYTNNNLCKLFAGRVFEVLSVGTLGSKSLPPTLNGVKNINITTRNYPLKPEEIRKKLKLADGGNDYLFATTMSDRQKILIHCKKVEKTL